MNEWFYFSCPQLAVASCSWWIWTCYKKFPFDPTLTASPLLQDFQLGFFYVPDDGLQVEVTESLDSAPHPAHINMECFKPTPDTESDHPATFSVQGHVLHPFSHPPVQSIAGGGEGNTGWWLLPRIPDLLLSMDATVNRSHKPHFVIPIHDKRNNTKGRTEDKWFFLFCSGCSLLQWQAKKENNDIGDQ